MMRCLTRLGILFSLLSFISACSPHKSSFVSGYAAPYNKTDDFRIPNPAESIILIFNQGTRNSNHYPDCDSERQTPAILKKLTRQKILGKQIYVYFLCTHVTGFNYIHGRAKEIEEQLDTFISMGIPARQLFLAGQSAGAWSSIITAGNAPEKFNALIGFAPAFSGVKAKRSGYASVTRLVEGIDIWRMQKLNALIFAFVGDPFNSIRDLRFLSNIPGVEFIPLPWDVIGGVHCRSNIKYAHVTAYLKCFLTQEGRIRNFIESRLR